MQREGKNQQDIRNELNIKTIRLKIEKRALERVGHVLRMDNSRQTKAAILGWYEELEGWRKTPGKKRKTVLYWKGLLKEAGVDWTDAGRLAADRDAWRQMVVRRVEHLDRWDRQRGHHRNDEELVQRSQPSTDDDPLTCKWPGCGKTCKNKGGLVIHQRRMHGESARPDFPCPRCHIRLKTENTLINHLKVCEGVATGDDGRRGCERCGREFSKSNIARHRKACTAGEAAGGARGRVRPEEVVARVHRARQKPCPLCGRMLAATNMARHMRVCEHR
jgi:hypothetical protein